MRSKVASRRNTRGWRKGTKGNTKAKGKRGTRGTRRTCRGKKQRMSSRNGKKVRFAKFESSGTNNRFRPTKGEIHPAKIADPKPRGYGDLLLAPPCCAHMKNYQDSIVGLVRCERTFYLTHKLPPKDFGCVELLTQPRGLRRNGSAPRVPAYPALAQGRRQDIVVRVPPPTRRRSDLYDEIVQERNKLHENAVRVSDFHRNECAGLDDEEEGFPDEPLSSRQFVDPHLVEHCPDCQKEANWCDCPICSNFI